MCGQSACAVPSSLPAYPERLLESVDGLLLVWPALLADEPLARDDPTHRPLLAPRSPRLSNPLTLPPAIICTT